MSPEEYNIREIQNGNFTQIMLARLVEFWQGTHSLEPDGKCGPNTQQSIVDSIFEDDGDIGPLAAAALDVARREIGHGEEGGNNSGQFVAKYHRIEDDGDDDDDGSWCAAFVSYCFEEGAKALGIEMPFDRSGGAKKLFSNIAATGSTVEDPKPGDVICWDRGTPGSWQGHIGIVESSADGVLHTIEGNVGAYPAKVKRLSYDLNELLLSPDSRWEGFARCAEGSALVEVHAYTEE
mgnify:FL=1